MKLHTGLVFAGLLAIGLTSYSCANGDTASSGGNGGSTGNGGNTSSGGTTGSGGSTAKGGSTGNGGSTAKGGNTGSGGSVSGSGGSTAKGGNTGSGGTGAVTGSGGTGTGSGGTGATGTGGSTALSCPSFAANATGFVTMPVKGGACWSGYAYTYADAFGTAVVPMSPTPGFSTCGMPCNLTMTGNIVAVSGSNYSYAGLGFNLGDSATGGTTHPTVVPTGSGLTIAFSNTTPSSLALRAQITDGTDTNTWCYTVTGSSPVTIPYGSFMQTCYNPTPGPAYAKQPINAIQLQIAGGTAPGALGVTITSVSENN